MQVSPRIRRFKASGFRALTRRASDKDHVKACVTKGSVGFAASHGTGAVGLQGLRRLSRFLASAFPVCGFFFWGG